MTDEKETPEAGEAESEEQAAEEVAEAEPTEGVAEAEPTEEVAEGEPTEEVAEAEPTEGVAEAEPAEEVAEARFTRRQLEQMTVPKLRDLAMELGEIAGVHGMKKGELVESIFGLRGAEEGEAVPVVSVDKTAIKQEISDLKSLRATALEIGDSNELKRVRKRIKRLKRTLRRAS